MMKKLLVLLQIVLIISLVICSCTNSEKEIKPAELVPEKNVGISSSDYANKPDMVHYALIFLNGDSLPSVREKLDSFNKKNSYRLRIIGTEINDEGEGRDQKKIILTIRKFDNLTSTENYTQKLMRESVLEKDNIVVSASQENYRRLLANKNIKEYISFYNKFINIDK